MRTSRCTKNNSIRPSCRFKNQDDGSDVAGTACSMSRADPNLLILLLIEGAKIPSWPAAFPSGYFAGPRDLASAIAVIAASVSASFAAPPCGRSLSQPAHPASAQHWLGRSFKALAFTVIPDDAKWASSNDRHTHARTHTFRHNSYYTLAARLLPRSAARPRNVT